MKTFLYGSLLMLLLFSKGLYAQYSVLEIIDATGGDCNGAIKISVDPAGAPHTFLWSDGGTNQNADDLCPGLYMLTITTVQGCEWQLEGIVNGVGGCYLNTRPEADIMSDCGANERGSITLLLSNPGAYNYTWTNGGTTHIIDQLTIGTYCVTVTDPSFSGCEVENCFTVTNDGCGSSGGGGLLSINEVSNGMLGNQEYVEILVSGGGNCETVNIGNYIIDDNDGTFTVNPANKGSGISSGHMRFLSGEIWGSVPSGALILIYNDQDKNPAITMPDDPLDLNQDKVYILPANHTLLETGYPDETGNYTYTSGGDWNTIGLYDMADAMQIRSPGNTYNHGISYGLPQVMNGGPDNLLLRPYNATDIVFSFLDTDFRDANYWSVANASQGNETPGYANNPQNLVFISSLCVDNGGGGREFAFSGEGVKMHEDGAVRFSPNPFKDLINIEMDWRLNDQVQIRLFDMLGRLVIEKPLSLNKGYNQFQLDIPSDVLSGLYQIALCKEDKVLLGQKVICMKSDK